MGFDAAALVGGLDAWREEAGDVAAPPPSNAADSVLPASRPG
jgi:hypothetical protein